MRPLRCTRRKEYENGLIENNITKEQLMEEIPRGDQDLKSEDKERVKFTCMQNT